MRVDNYLDNIDNKDLNGCERFRDGGKWSLELIAPQAFLDLLPKCESKNWWEVVVVIYYREGIFEAEREALDEYGVKNIDEINAHSLRRFYDVSQDEERYRTDIL